MEGVYDQVHDLPPNWQRSKLGDVMEVIRGASPRPKGDPRLFGGRIPWVMISDVTREKGKYLSQTRDYVTEEGARKSRHLKAGTLILSNSGTVCVPKILAVDGCIHDGFVAFPVIPEQFDILYLYYFFDYIRPRVIDVHRQGITQVNLNTNLSFFQVKNYADEFLARVEGKHESTMPPEDDTVGVVTSDIGGKGTVSGTVSCEGKKVSGVFSWFFKRMRKEKRTGWTSFR